jgi:hypothetical protein
MSLQLTSGRMATFSDGVIAVIITVMVLDLNRSLPNTYASWRRSDKAGNFLGSLCRSHSLSYHSLTVAMTMLAVVAVLWLTPSKRVLEMTRAKSGDL